MNAWDAVGFLASSLVITAFCMKDIVHLRIVAVASNIAFLTYGIALGLTPVWLLHLLLLPLNLGRLRQSTRIKFNCGRSTNSTLRRRRHSWLRRRPHEQRRKCSVLAHH